MTTITLIISDDTGASVVANVTRVGLSQDTGLIGYRQALAHPVDQPDERGAPRTISEVSYEIANGDVLVLEAGKPIAHFVTGPQAVKFRPGGKRADEESAVPMFVGPAEPKGHPLPTVEEAFEPNREGEPLQ